MKTIKNLTDLTEEFMYFVKRIIMTALLIGLIPAISVNAQYTKKAQVGFRFMSNPVSAEAVGRGMTGIVNTYNSNGIFWNPALVSLVPGDVDVSINHTKGIADINYNSAAATVDLFGYGKIGFSFLMMDYGTFYQTVRSSNTEGFEETGTFSPNALVAGVAFSQNVTENFSYGVHLKYARQDLGGAWVGNDNAENFTRELREYEQSTLAVDVGAYYDFGYKGIKFAATLQNISREIRYENSPFPLPFAISFGASVEPLAFAYDDDGVNKLVVNIETLHPRDFGEKIKYGAEYKFMDMFTIRGGYATNYDERGFSAGVGFNHILSEIPFRLDYAIQPFGLFGNVHYLSLGVSY